MQGAGRMPSIRSFDEFFDEASTYRITLPSLARLVDASQLPPSPSLVSPSSSTSSYRRRQSHDSRHSCNNSSSQDSKAIGRISHGRGSVVVPASPSSLTRNLHEADHTLTPDAAMAVTSGTPARGNERGGERANTGSKLCDPISAYWQHHGRRYTALVQANDDLGKPYTSTEDNSSHYTCGRQQPLYDGSARIYCLSKLEPARGRQRGPMRGSLAAVANPRMPPSWIAADNDDSDGEEDDVGLAGVTGTSHPLFEPEVEHLLAPRTDRVSGVDAGLVSSVPRESDGESRKSVCGIHPLRVLDELRRHMQATYDMARSEKEQTETIVDGSGSELVGGAYGSHHLARRGPRAIPIFFTPTPARYV